MMNTETLNAQTPELHISHQAEKINHEIRYCYFANNVWVFPEKHLADYTNHEM